MMKAGSYDMSSLRNIFVVVLAQLLNVDLAGKSSSV